MFLLEQSIMFGMNNILKKIYARDIGLNNISQRVPRVCSYQLYETNKNTNIILPLVSKFLTHWHVRSSKCNFD